MIFYYTFTKRAKTIAEALHTVTGLPLYPLRSKLDEKKGFLFLLKALPLAAAGKAYPVANMPGVILAGEIYVCSPVWGGRPAGPVLYFLKHAALKGKKVHLVLVSGSNNDKYRQNALRVLQQTDCVPGCVYGFAAGKADEALIVAQLREMLP